MLVYQGAIRNRYRVRSLARGEGRIQKICITLIQALACHYLQEQGTQILAKGADALKSRGRISVLHRLEVQSGATAPCTQVGERFDMVCDKGFILPIRRVQKIQAEPATDQLMVLCNSHGFILTAMVVDI